MTSVNDFPIATSPLDGEYVLRAHRGRDRPGDLVTLDHSSAARCLAEGSVERPPEGHPLRDAVDRYLRQLADHPMDVIPSRAIAGALARAALAPPPPGPGPLALPQRGHHHRDPIDRALRSGSRTEAVRIMTSAGVPPADAHAYARSMPSEAP